MKKLFYGLVALSIPLALSAAPNHHGGGGGIGGGGGGGLGPGPGHGGIGIGQGKLVLIQKARQLSFTLQSIAQQAQFIAQRARYNGAYLRARKMRNLAWSAQNLAYEVKTAIVRPLVRGRSKLLVASNLQSIQPQFRYLNMIANNIYVKPPAMQSKLYKAKQLFRQLKGKLLFGGGGFGRHF